MNGDWGKYKTELLTVSLFHRVCHLRPFTSCHNIVKTIRYPRDLTGAAVSWGRQNEKRARDKLEGILGKTNKIESCGIFLDPNNPGLAASPDGITQKGELVEIKYPYNAKNMMLTEAYESNVKVITRLFTDSRCNQIKEIHEYYYQIQGQLNICERDVCYLFVWTTIDYRVIEIRRNVKTRKNMMCPKVNRFYNTCVKPELIDSRLARKMRIKDPPHIVEAQRIMKENVWCMQKVYFLAD